METQIEFISLGEALIVAPRKEFEWSGVKKKKKKTKKTHKGARLRASLENKVCFFWGWALIKRSCVLLHSALLFFVRF